jgi:hypothetical protein
VNTSNANLDGFDASETAPVATVMRNNYTQILQKTIKIAETTDAVSRYGRAKETAYQIAKAGEEVKRDLEAILLNNQAAVAGSNAVARLLASYQQMVDAGNFVHTGGAGTTMTETHLLTLLQTLYTNGVDPSILMVTPTDANTVSAYAAASGRYRTIPNENAGASKKVVNAVDLYVSPFGEVKVVLNRFLLSTDSLVYTPEYWKLCTLRPWTRESLAKVGDATRLMIVGEFSLKHANQKASGFVRRVA